MKLSYDEARVLYGVVYEQASFIHEQIKFIKFGDLDSSSPDFEIPAYILKDLQYKLATLNKVQAFIFDEIKVNLNLNH